MKLHKRYLKESHTENKIYNNLTAEQAHNILDNWKDNYRITIDDVDCYLEPSLVNNPLAMFDLWCEDAFFYHRPYDEMVEILQDIDSAIQRENDKANTYRKEALPQLWKQLTNGTWQTSDGKYIDDFFSDYYKDAFGHRPRSFDQAAREISDEAKRLGVKLDEARKRPVKEAYEGLGEKAWMLNQIISHMNNECAYFGSWVFVWPDGETRAQCRVDFADKEDYEELENSFKRTYTKYHKDGLFKAPAPVLALAREWDKKLGLEPIVDTSIVADTKTEIEDILRNNNVDMETVRIEDGTPNHENEGYTVQLEIIENMPAVKSALDEFRKKFSYVFFDFKALGGPRIYLRK